MKKVAILSVFCSLLFTALASQNIDELSVEQLLLQVKENKKKQYLASNVKLPLGNNRIKGYFFAGAPYSIFQICGEAEAIEIEENSNKDSLYKLGTGAKYVEATGELSLNTNSFGRRLKFEITKIHEVNENMKEDCVWDMSRWQR